MRAKLLDECEWTTQENDNNIVTEGKETTKEERRGRQNTNTVQASQGPTTNQYTGSLMSTMAPLTLYRSLLRQGKLIKDYNFRSYALRRVKTGFQENRGLQGCVRLHLRWIGLEMLWLLCMFVVRVNLTQLFYRCYFSPPIVADHPASDSWLQRRGCCRLEGRRTTAKDATSPSYH